MNFEIDSVRIFIDDFRTAISSQQDHDGERRDGRNRSGPSDGRGACDHANHSGGRHVHDGGGFPQESWRRGSLNQKSRLYNDKALPTLRAILKQKNTTRLLNSCHTNL